MFDFIVELKNGKLVSTLRSEHSVYCVIWDSTSVVSIVTTHDSEDGAHEFYYF